MCTNRKPIAWVLFFIFYFQLVSTAFAGSLSAPYLYNVTPHYKSVSVAAARNPVVPRSINWSGTFKKRGSLAELKKENKPAVALAGDLLNNNSADGPGPTQPEMQSFQSVNTNNMVDLFTGDFSYNIPLLDVGGYPVSMHYSSGITMDQEASWVGLGWNINAGTINRTMRGLPDDFNGNDFIKKTVSINQNRTIGITAGANVEIFGKPSSIGATVGVFHNTYNGWGTETSLNAGINSGGSAKGSLSGGIGLTNNSQSGLDISPSFSYKIGKNDMNEKGLGVGIATNYNSRIGIQALQMSMQMRQQANQSKIVSMGSVGTTAQISFATPSFTPSMTLPFTSAQATYTVKVGGELWGLHGNFSISGHLSNQYIAPKDQSDSFAAYGYLYYQEAANHPKALLDFNREKDVAFRGTTPNIAIPGYTYDIYSISGEGTGGMFRPYRGDIGMIYDHTLATKSSSTSISADLGFGATFHGGVDLNKVWAGTKNNPWLKDNVMAQYVGFKKSDSLYENAYFKNPGEKVTADQDYFNKIGDDKLVRVQLSPVQGSNAPVVTATHNLTLFSNARAIGNIALNSAYKKKRDKRTQVISYLTAKEASVAGLDKQIKSYAINSFPSLGCTDNYTLIPRVGDARKENHLSEISVLNTDGRKYVYGIPAYNLEQNDVSFSVEKKDGNNTTGLVKYIRGLDNSPDNLKGKDHYFSKETIPGYAHSFLLSGIESADYVDITGDGITEDDNGNAVKFNYSEVYNKSTPYKWRAPFSQDSASYNEGLKTYSRDDKGSYSYGTKEVWYMNSIESKTMMATFVLETDSTRQDSYGTLDENGGIDLAQKLYRLREINLYTKADVLKNGIGVAKPIKTVHFGYSYELSGGVSSSNHTGKLTLKKVWFTYNNNQKGKLNPYIFTYAANNPAYNTTSYDRWGNFKNPNDNPGKPGSKLTNAEYPYTLQKTVNGWDSTKAASNAAAWTLNQVKLPSGGLMKVAYESDDYAYVQNRRAMQLFSIAGLGADASSSVTNSLYLPGKANSDYLYVYVKLNDAVSSRSEIQERYLDGVKKLYFKLFVKMPDSKDGNRWGSGYEQIPCFADIVDYDIKAGSDNKMIWIKVAALGGNSPMATSALQFLRLNLPGTAYPFSEPGDSISFSDAIGMLLSVGKNMVNTVEGFTTASKKGNRCNTIDTTRSFIRLDNPDFKKLGGGLRVKNVQIFDNWMAMTNQTESSYGQSYDYTTTKVINGAVAVISSGVSSYEPALGKEENPFYNPIEYAEKMALAGPADYLYTEEPLGESFFPSSTVGYSKVSVQTINNTKKSANGTDVTEFYTEKDFPTIFENTPLDKESKKTYAPAIANFLKFDAKRYVTLSQGFKVELNDMHGKVKSQSSFAQTDLAHPISYTYNYYKLDNDNALNKHLNNSVSTIDSATGTINGLSQMGKDIDLMFDIREQTSSTISASVQLNIDFFFAGVWPCIIPSIPNLPSFETDRYRSIAATKVINRYAILDSVVHFDKGSKISTANMLYDGETGNVLLSRTQNEFDDPLYSFNYPAYWAYSGMEGAYKNIGGIFRNVQFLNGKVAANSIAESSITSFFESGDELLLYGKVKIGRGSETCLVEDYYNTTFFRDTTMRVWAIDLAKSGGTSTGIFFIDKDGKPITGLASSMKIIRSGKRNLQSISAGAVTSLQNPIRIVDGVNKIVFDSASSVIAASATSFKDFWKVDSSSYRKDTIINIAVQADIKKTTFYANDIDAVMNDHPNAKVFQSNEGRDNYIEWVKQPDFFSQTFAVKGGDRSHSSSAKKSAVLFGNLVGTTGIPQGSIIQSASLDMSSAIYFIPAKGQVNTNNAYISASSGAWIKDILSQLPPSTPPKQTLQDFFFNRGSSPILANYRLQTGLRNGNFSYFSDDILSQPNDTMKRMVQLMLDNYYTYKYKPSIVIDQQYNQENTKGENIMSFNYSSKEGHRDIPSITVSYYAPCNQASSYTKGIFFSHSHPIYTPFYSATPVPGYYCMTSRDSFICKPNINDTAFNPYRWGAWGNWQTDRAYSYYNSRKDSMVNIGSVTNIRKDGEIKSFVPFWKFTSTKISAFPDSLRWVWNSEINMINSKGLELQNHDPLDRYNAAQYGYNQTLPVAVGQNTRNREMVYDGFEDYGYTTNNCSSCAPARFINFLGNGTLVDSVSHSGIYSLRVEGNTANSISVPIVTYTSDTTSAKIIGKATATMLPGLVPDTVVNGVGTGLNGYRSMYLSPRNYRDGFIQPRYSEWYNFYASASSRSSININNNRISEYTTVESGPSNGVLLKRIFLYKGQLYTITLSQSQPYKDIKLEWQSSNQAREVVPVTQLYNTNNPGGSISVIKSRLCIKMDTLKQAGISLQKFSPLQGTKILIGAWVREKGNTPDTVTNYRNTQIKLVFNNGVSFLLKPTGNIIEGWQRIEEVVTIPPTATTMDIQLGATNSLIPVFFDDIRIHPYNSNLKSFVYNPVNLRLMAELDENNYASFYEYDDDGTLIRVKKETARGIMTIKETRSALLK